MGWEDRQIPLRGPLPQGTKRVHLHIEKGAPPTAVAVLPSCDMDSSFPRFSRMRAIAAGQVLNDGDDRVLEAAREWVAEFWTDYCECEWDDAEMDPAYCDCGGLANCEDGFYETDEYRELQEEIEEEEELAGMQAAQESGERIDTSKDVWPCPNPHVIWGGTDQASWSPFRMLYKHDDAPWFMAMGSPSMFEDGTWCHGSNYIPRTHVEAWHSYWNARHNNHIPPPTYAEGRGGDAKAKRWVAEKVGVEIPPNTHEHIMRYIDDNLPPSLYETPEERGLLLQVLLAHATGALVDDTELRRTVPGAVLDVDNVGLPDGPDDLFNRHTRASKPRWWLNHYDAYELGVDNDDSDTEYELRAKALGAVQMRRDWKAAMRAVRRNHDKFLFGNDNRATGQALHNYLSQRMQADEERVSSSKRQLGTDLSSLLEMWRSAMACLRAYRSVPSPRTYQSAIQALGLTAHGTPTYSAAADVWPKPVRTAVTLWGGTYRHSTPKALRRICDVLGMPYGAVMGREGAGYYVHGGVPAALSLIRIDPEEVFRKWVRMLWSAPVSSVTIMEQAHGLTVDSFLEHLRENRDAPDTFRWRQVLQNFAYESKQEMSQHDTSAKWFATLSPWERINAIGRSQLFTPHDLGFDLDKAAVWENPPPNAALLGLNTAVRGRLEATDRTQAVLQAVHLGSGMLRGLFECGADPDDVCYEFQSDPRKRRQGQGGASPRGIGTLLACVQDTPYSYITTIGGKMYRGVLTYSGRGDERRGYDTTTCECECVLVWGEFNPNKETP